MADVVTYDEIERTAPRTVSISGTAIELSATRLGLKRRKSFVLVPTTAGVTATIIKGGEFGSGAVLAGIPLGANQLYGEADSDNFNCWQGPINVIASGAGAISISETFDP